MISLPISICFVSVFKPALRLPEPVEIYIDNIVIEEISAENASTITAHYNNGTDKTKVFSGSCGPAVFAADFAAGLSV